LPRRRVKKSVIWRKSWKEIDANGRRERRSSVQATEVEVVDSVAEGMMTVSEVVKAEGRVRGALVAGGSASVTVRMRGVREAIDDVTTIDVVTMIGVAEIVIVTKMAVPGVMVVSRLLQDVARLIGVVMIVVMIVVVKIVVHQIVVVTCDVELIVIVAHLTLEIVAVGRLTEIVADRLRMEAAGDLVVDRIAALLIVDLAVAETIGLVIVVLVDETSQEDQLMMVGAVVVVSVGMVTAMMTAVVIVVASAAIEIVIAVTVIVVTVIAAASVEIETIVEAMTEVRGVVMMSHADRHLDEAIMGPLTVQIHQPTTTAPSRLKMRAGPRSSVKASIRRSANFCISIVSPLDDLYL